MWHPFDASNEEGTCLWCGRKLRKERFGQRLGDYGDGHFCGLRCAYQFAVRMARLGERLERTYRLLDPPPGWEQR